MIRIRRATIKDLNTLQILAYHLGEAERKGWDPTLDSIWVLSAEGRRIYRFALENKYVLFAEDGDKTIGYLIGDVYHPREKAIRQSVLARLANIFVVNDYRHQGVGKMLFQAFREHCQKQGVDDLEVLVLAKNESALKFYKQMGFAPRRVTLMQKLK